MRVRRKLEPSEPDNFGIITPAAINGLRDKIFGTIQIAAIGVTSISLVVGESLEGIHRLVGAPFELRVEATRAWLDQLLAVSVSVLSTSRFAETDHTSSLDGVSYLLDLERCDEIERVSLTSRSRRQTAFIILVTP